MGRLAELILRFNRITILIFGLLALVSLYGISFLKFSFDFEQLFPQGDPDLEFFKEFVDEFEGDDSFLLIAIERPKGVFDSVFLQKVDSLTKITRDWPFVVSSHSLTTLKEPVKTPFGLITIPTLHINEPSKYPSDQAKIMSNPRIAGHLITKDQKALVVSIKTADGLDLSASQQLISHAEESIGGFGFSNVRYLGRPFFQKEMVDMQKRELGVATLISGFLVTFVLILLFRRTAGVIVSMLTIGLGLLLFLGFLSASGRDLNILSALYPLLMIIVGTSDVVHIMTKYISELRKGLHKKEAMSITLRQIGIATLFTSVTTSIGYLSLMTSRIVPVKDFGINSAIGVMMAYVIAITFLVAMLYLFPLEKLIKTDTYHQRWNRMLLSWHQLTIDRAGLIKALSVIFLVFCLYGISLISTNYKLVDNLPRGKKITNDFLFFEKELSGFRPVEFAVSTKDKSSIDNFKSLKELDKLSTYLMTKSEINTVFSYIDIYKSLNQAYHNNKSEYYTFPDNKRVFNTYNKKAQAFASKASDQLLNRDKDKMRIITRFDDLGADVVKATGKEIDTWILDHLDLSNLNIKRTGTGLILDKNSGYVLESLLSGLAIAIIIVSMLMMLLFRDWRMLIISMIPNIFPLLFAGAMLGYLGIEMEAGVSITFAIVFGIAVDDTIHFLSKFKLAKDQGLALEEAIRTTFLETGKAICLTTIILFFGFLVLLFSINPPSITIGLLISVTLISALISDFMLIPILLRWMYATKK